MSRYVRPSGSVDTFFFTARAARRGDDLFTSHIDALRSAMRHTRASYPFVIEEIVVLPDVIHTLWTLQDRDGDHARRWRMLKNLFSRNVNVLTDAGPQHPRTVEKGLWHRRIWEHRIRGADDLAAHRHLIFCAPVQAGLVDCPKAWPHSSVHRAAARGTYTPDPSTAVSNPPPPDKVA